MSELSKEERKAAAIKNSQDKQLKKFQKELKLFKERPQLKEFKKVVFDEIEQIINEIEDRQTSIKNLQYKLNAINAIVTSLENKKKYWAKILAQMDEIGIFMDSDKFIFAKGSKTKDVDSMYNSLSDEEKKLYQKEEIKYKIDKDKLLAEKPIVYKIGDPQIRIKTKNEVEYDE